MHSVIDSEGLGMFISGEYAAQHDVAGMLGYVQIETNATWADRIASAMAADSPHYCLVSALSAVTVTSEVSDVRLSSHHRISVGRWLAIYHAFLMFMS